MKKDRKAYEKDTEPIMNWRGFRAERAMPNVTMIYSPKIGKRIPVPHRHDFFSCWDYICPFPGDMDFIYLQVTSTDLDIALESTNHDPFISLKDHMDKIKENWHGIGELYHFISFKRRIFIESHFYVIGEWIKAPREYDTYLTQIYDFTRGLKGAMEPIRQYGDQFRDPYKPQ